MFKISSVIFHFDIVSSLSRKSTEPSDNKTPMKIATLNKTSIEQSHYPTSALKRKAEFYRNNFRIFYRPYQTIGLFLGSLKDSII